MHRVQKKRSHEIYSLGSDREKELRRCKGRQLRYKGRQLRILVYLYLRVCLFSALSTKLSGFAKFLFPFLGSDWTSTIHKDILQHSAFLSDRSKCLSSLRTLWFFFADKMSVLDHRKKMSVSFQPRPQTELSTLNCWLDSLLTAYME